MMIRPTPAIRARTWCIKSSIKQSGSLKAEIVREYDADRDLLTSIRMDWDPAGTPETLSRYDYRYDLPGRRKDVVYSGAAFGGAGNEQLDVWTYNSRNELTAVNRHAGSNPDAAGHGGHRPATGVQLRPHRQPRDVHRGHGRGAVLLRERADQYEETGADADCDPFTEEFTYDADGNLIAGGAGVSARTYAWDAENRLIAAEPAGTPGVGDQKVTFGYDYQNRRIWKKVFAWDPNSGPSGDWKAAPSVHRKFVWFNWLMLLELEGGTGVPPVDSVVRRYTWGLDLSGQHGAINSLEQAGGIGGLLAIQDEKFDTSTKNYLACYDGNGNLTQLLLRSDGSFQARYEYDAYGNVVDLLDAYAAENPVRFSTKYWDEETGLGYWGERYYCHHDGRWFNRDPLQEAAIA